MADHMNPADTAGWLIAASKIIGTSVYSRSGEKIGSISDVMIDKRSGKTDYAIMNFGGFLGIGGQYHPLPWQSLTYDEELEGYVVDVDRTRLEGAPALTVNENTDPWYDPEFRRRINSYYGF